MGIETNDDAVIEWMESPNVAEEPRRCPESVFTIRATRDLKPRSRVQLNASALRQLANALDRLMAFHQERGGSHPDLPQIYRIELGPHGTISAHIQSGTQQFRLDLTSESWVLA